MSNMRYAVKNAALTVLAVGCLSGVWCRAAHADDPVLEANTDSVSVLATNDGPGDQGSSGSGENSGGTVPNPDQNPNNQNNQSNQPPPCTVQVAGGVLTGVSIVSILLSPPCSP